MTKPRVTSYFNTLKECLTENNLLDKSDFIWNMDESYLNLSARKGSKYLHCKTGSRENVTIIACANAAGKMIPPHIIVKGKTKNALKSWDTEKAPKGTILSVSDSGWIKQGLSLLWFTQVFLKNIGPSRPQVLIFDGHDSHHHIELVTAARENNVILVEIPAHCSHWLQPLDRTFFGPLKTKWKQALQTFTNETGHTVTHSRFFHLFNRAWSAVLENAEKIVNGFRCTGICPLNENVIPREAYLPNQPYAQSETHEEKDQSDEAPLARSTESSTEAELHEDVSPPDVQDQQTYSFTALPLESLDVPVDTLEDIPLLDYFPDSSLYNIVDTGLRVIENSNTITPSKQKELCKSSCPPELALAAVECSLTKDMRANYELALKTGRNINDKTFSTWKHFKELAEPHIDFPFCNTSTPVDDDSDVLPYPQPIAAQPKKKAGKENRGFFVISCDEAYAEKVKKLEDKERKDKGKLNKM